MIEKNRDLGKDVPNNGQVVRPIVGNKGKEPVVPDNVDTLADDELSSDSTSPLSLSLAKDTRGSTKAKHKRSLQHLAFSTAVSGASHRARREVGRRQNQLAQALRNALLLPEVATPPLLPIGMMPLMPLIRPAFGAGPTFYMPPTTLIRIPDDMLSSPLRQHILDY